MYISCAKLTKIARYLREDQCLIKERTKKPVNKNENLCHAAVFFGRPQFTDYGMANLKDTFRKSSGKRIAINQGHEHYYRSTEEFLSGVFQGFIAGWLLGHRSRSSIYRFSLFQ